MAAPVPFDIAERQQALAAQRRQAIEDAVPGTTGEVIARVVNGFDEQALKLIDAGVPMGDRLDHALLAAARTNRGNLMQKLIARGAPFAELEAEVYCAAAAQGSIAVLRALTDCDPNAPDALGWPPLFHAAVNGQSMAVEYLLDARADRHLRDPQGFTAADRAARAGQHAIADLLKPMELPHDLDTLDLATLDNLFIAAARGNRPSAFEPLIRAGADLSVLGGRALCAATGAGAIDAVRRLLVFEVPVMAAGEGGDNALLAAGRMAFVNKALIDLLMAWGAEGAAAQLKAEGLHGSAACVANGLATRALFKAVWDDSAAGVEAALAAGADVNGRLCFAVTYLEGRRYEGSDTALIRAAATGRIKAAEQLLKVRGIDLDAESGLPFDTALMRAVNFGAREIALMLVTAGADPRRPGRLSGRSPLDVAVMQNDLMLIGRFKRWRGVQP
jgi:ankyrin repeat protein